MNNYKENRYFRQLQLPDFGDQEQQMLEKSVVLVAGLGGLGSPVSAYLAAAGVGKLILCDHGIIELSNLNRQILFSTSEMGLNKTVAAAEFIRNLNPEIEVDVYSEKLSRKNLFSFGREVDVIADCLDNITSRLEINKYSMDNQIPLVHAGIEGWHGQVTTIAPPGTPCLKCLFNDAKDTDENKPVLGAVAGMIGTLQALEIVHILTGNRNTLKNRLVFFDGHTMEWSQIPIKSREDCSVCGKIHE